MEKKVLHVFRTVTSFARESPRWYNASVLMAIGVIVLFLLSPNDKPETFPTLGASRFLWTPAIPILSSFCILIWTFLSLDGQLDSNQTLVASIGVVFLIFLAIQFAINSPLGVDGWFFYENARYFSQFGDSGRMPYDSHPLVMLPVDFTIRIFESSGVAAATLLGFLMSLGWTITVLRGASPSPNFHRNGILATSGLCLFFLVTGWNPLRYSAHLLGLLLGHHLIHKRENTALTSWDLVIAFFLSISHSFAPIIFGTIFFFDSFLRTNGSSRSRWLGLIISLSFIFWNANLGLSRFSKYLLINDPETVELALILSIPCVLVFATSYLYERKSGKRQITILGGGSGASNISVILACIACIPILYAGELELAENRFIHRLVTYSAVPLLWGAIWVIDQFLDAIENHVNSSSDEGGWAGRMHIIFLALALANGGGSGILQTSHIENLEAMPTDSYKCWDMVEASGALGPMYGQKGRFVLISDQLQPPLAGSKYWDFKKHGDDSTIPNLGETNIWAILETPDFYEKLGPYTTYTFDDFVLISEVPNSCRLWLNPDYLHKLDTEVNWHHLESISTL